MKFLRCVHRLISIPDKLILDKILSVFNARSLSMDIWQRNDKGWTREAIADWLEAQGL
jgi:hypothetical protein